MGIKFDKLLNLFREKESITDIAIPGVDYMPIFDLDATAVWEDNHSYSKGDHCYILGGELPAAIYKIYTHCLEDHVSSGQIDLTKFQKCLIVMDTVPSIGTPEEDYGLPPYFMIEWTDLENDAPCDGSSTVEDWNGFFFDDNGVTGNCFSKVIYSGNKVYLFGGSDIVFPTKFADRSGYGEFIVRIKDTAGSVIELLSYSFANSNEGDGCPELIEAYLQGVKTIGASAFYDCANLGNIYIPEVTSLGTTALRNCSNLTSLFLPKAAFIGYNALMGCTGLNNVYMPVCKNLGDSPGADNTFALISGNTINMTISSHLLTNNSGGVDASIVGVQANNTVTLTTIDNKTVEKHETDYDHTGFAASNHTHNYLTDVVDDTAPQLGGDLDTNGKNINLSEQTLIVLDNAMSEDEKWNGIAIAGVAGSALAKGDLIAFQASDSRWELCDANVITAAAGDSRGILGICLTTAGADGDAIQVLIWGIIRSASFPSFGILNAPVYISETAGDITLTAPTTEDVCVRVIGFSLSADDLLFNPSNDYYTYKP